jgi:formylglycine-generating enzyme required for sulfatase activity
MMFARVMFLLAATTGATGALGAVALDLVTVGNPGNAPDPSATFLGSAVAYVYQISKYEVTNGQYVEFLNAKASADPLGLYDTSMGSAATGGIARSGSDGSYAYAVKVGYVNMPVTFVNWFDAARFANWLHNGQGTGDTESGAYTLLGGTATPSNSATVARNPDAAFALPTENEWHKAAYHHPASDGGDSDDYWLYPTRSNAEANSDQPPGAAAISSNAANFNRNDSIANGYNDGYAVTGSTTLVSSQNYLTAVGAYVNSPSYYGTFDQGGNVWEWTERASGPTVRGRRGGSWSSSSFSLRSVSGESTLATNADGTMGIRIVVLPEPGVGLALLAVAGLVVGRRRGR